MKRDVNFNPNTSFAEAGQYLKDSIQAKDVPKTLEILHKIKSFLSRSEDYNKIHFDEFFKTDIYYQIRQLKQAYYFGDVNIRTMILG